ncbi:hypothetical protein M2650_05515 [Luteimonas sp. SX5]|uniref:Uncharacterized protein n=1 Tax=Luteimonas galliterrae TaxID=2940486 RepID=A0ABT0MGV5_9GAMM|nr:hypothetical protein [Luteimonas galliterrae]MCL1634089.1 hypothetical protein [Luteimonas galliterrae]
MTGRISALLISTALAAAALGCTSTTAAGENSGARSVPVAQTFAMKPGESVALAGNGQLKYVGVKNDSRCPPERQCVWAGDAEVTFEWTATGAGTESFGLHTGFADKASRPVAGHRLALVSLARGANPEAQLRFDSLP